LGCSRNYPYFPPWKVVFILTPYPLGISIPEGFVKTPHSSLQCYPLEKKLDLSPLSLGIFNGLLLDGGMDIFWNYTFP